MMIRGDYKRAMMLTSSCGFWSLVHSRYLRIRAGSWTALSRLRPLKRPRGIQT
jgi:hypothetical protein